MSRHITTVHKNEDLVKKALQQPRREKLSMLESLKKMGIEKYNIEQLNEPKPKLIRQRTDQLESGDHNRISNVKVDLLVKCSKCKGFFSRLYYSRHQKICGESDIPVPLKISTMSKALRENIYLSEEFRHHVINKLREDKCGDMVRSDTRILEFGCILYDKIKRRVEKKVEIRKQVRSDMRRLATLFLHFKDQSYTSFYQNSSDMCRRENFLFLRKAIEECTTKEDSSLKASLKAAIYYLLKNLAKVVKGSFLMENRDLDARAMDDFITILEMCKDNIFGEATQKIHKDRQIKLRKPQQLPLEEDISNLRNYILKRINEIVNDPLLLIDASTYIELRDCTCARLTLFNARRGGEPARLLLNEWQEAEDNEWIDSERAGKIEDPIEKFLINSLKITYQMGKGNFKLVPVIFTNDTHKAMRKLVDPNIRDDVGILRMNKYVFPTTQGSDTHASGWHLIKSICDKIHLQNSSIITATKQRHRVSTIFASYDLTEGDRMAFYEHMGHGKDINENIYQAPPAIKELTKVGKHLSRIDNNSTGKLLFLISN